MILNSFYVLYYVLDGPLLVIFVTKDVSKEAEILADHHILL